MKNKNIREREVTIRHKPLRNKSMKGNQEICVKGNQESYKNIIVYVSETSPLGYRPEKIPVKDK